MEENNNLEQNVQEENVSVVNEKVEEPVVATETKKEPTKKSNKTPIIILLVLFAVACGVFCYLMFGNKDDKKKEDKKDEETTTIESSSSVKKNDYVINSNSLEAFDLFFLQTENNKTNMVYSPLSIKYALEMLETGANGDSKDQILSVIGSYKARKYENSANMAFANALFVNSNAKDAIKEEYVNNLKTNFGAEVVYDSFNATDAINAWINNHTLSLIPNGVDSVDPEIMYILVNALGIDMEWVNVIQPKTNSWFVRYPNENFGHYVGALNSSGYRQLDFDENQKVKTSWIGAALNNYDIISDLGEDKIKETVGNAYQKWIDEGGYEQCGKTWPEKEEYLNQNFATYLEELGKGYGQASASTDFMLYVDDNTKVFAKDLKEYNGVTLQYVGIMPTNVSLDSYIENVTAEDLNKLISNLKEVKLENFKDGVITKIEGFIPLFNFDYQLNLKEDLEKLGITDVFDMEKADLSNISDNKSYISDASHKANIEFSNEGIKAAAVTTMGGSGAADCGFYYNFDVPVEEIDLSFDKPYMFIIRDKATGEVWFAGTVYEPTKYESMY